MNSKRGIGKIKKTMCCTQNLFYCSLNMQQKAFNLYMVGFGLKSVLKLCYKRIKNIKLLNACLKNKKNPRKVLRIKHFILKCLLIILILILKCPVSCLS